MLTEIRRQDRSRSFGWIALALLAALGVLAPSAQAQIGDNSFRDAVRGISFKIPARWVQIDPADREKVAGDSDSFNAYTGFCRSSGFLTLPLVVLADSDFAPKASSLRVLQKMMDASPIDDVPGLKQGATIAEVFAKLPPNDVLVFDEQALRYYRRMHQSAAKSESNRAGRNDLLTVGFIAGDRMHELGFLAVEGSFDLSAADFELFATSFRIDSDREWKPSAPEKETKRGSKGGVDLQLTEGERNELLVVGVGALLAIGVCILNAVIKAMAR